MTQKLYLISSDEETVYFALSVRSRTVGQKKREVPYDEKESSDSETSCSIFKCIKLGSLKQLQEVAMLSVEPSLSKSESALESKSGKDNVKAKKWHKVF